MKNKYKILFICTGNTCRSPMAVGILRSLLPSHLSGLIEADSSGIFALEGYEASENASEVAREHQVDISGHVSKSLSGELIRESDLVLTMEKNHKDYIIKNYPDSFSRVFCLKEFTSGGNKYEDFSIKDPYGGTLEIYRNTFYEIKYQVLKLIEKLEEIFDN